MFSKNNLLDLDTSKTETKPHYKKKISSTK